MNKTLEQLILDTEFKDLSEEEMEYVKKTMFSNIYSFEKVVELLKHIRELTIKECVGKVTWYYVGPQEYIFHYQDDIHVNKTELLNLDLNTIDI